MQERGSLHVIQSIRLHRAGGAAPADHRGADRQRKLCQRRCAPRRGQLPHQQVFRGLSRPARAGQSGAVLRRLRRGGPAGGILHRQVEGGLSHRLPCERPAPQRLLRQPCGVFRPAAARRQHPVHEPVQRRAPDPRLPGEFLRQAVRHALLRCGRERLHRLRRHGAHGADAPPQADPGRCIGLQPHHRLPALRGRRTGNGRAVYGGHGARGRSGGGGRASQPLRSGGCDHHHHSQDPARPPGRPDLLPPGAGEENRQRRVPRHPGRPPAARHRRQSGGGGGGAHARVPDVHPRGGGQQPRHGRRVHRHGLQSRHRRHG